MKDSFRNWSTPFKLFSVGLEVQVYFFSKWGTSVPPLGSVGEVGRFPSGFPWLPRSRNTYLWAGDFSGNCF